MNKFEGINPAQIRGDHEISVWAPGQQVVFYRPMNCFMIIFAWFFLLGGVGLSTFSFFTLTERMNVGSFVIQCGLGILFLWMGTKGTLYHLPHTITLNWVEGTMTSARPFRKWTISLNEIREVILQGKAWKGGGPYAYPPPPQYSVQFKFSRHSGKNPSFFVLMESEPDYNMSLVVEKWIPLLKSLACALGVPGLVLDCDGKSIRKI